MTPASDPPATAAWEMAIESFRAAATVAQTCCARLDGLSQLGDSLSPARRFRHGTKKGPCDTRPRSQSAGGVYWTPEASGLTPAYASTGGER